jgi:hypothetical protein
LEQLKKEAEKKASEKYTRSLELKKVKERLKKLKLYKPGEVISFQDKNGNEYTGLYRQLKADKIFIAGNEIPLSSLAPEVRVHFDEELCNAKKNSVRDDIHNEIQKSKQQFIEDYISKNKQKYLRSNGYIQEKRSGKWVAEYDILKYHLKKAENKMKSSIARKQRKQWKEFSESFDRDKFIENLGYIKQNDTWITQKEFIDRKVNAEKEKYNKKRDERFAQFEKDFKQTEKEIYFENGYLSTADGWKPAKTVLDEEIRKIFH